MRWLYHLLPADLALSDPYAPASLASEGFVHASYKPAVRESARLHFPPDARLDVLQIDPRLVDARIEEAQTPRGPMPHVFGPIPRRAVSARFPLDALDAAPDLLAPADPPDPPGAKGN